MDDTQAVNLLLPSGAIEATGDGDILVADNNGIDATIYRFDGSQWTLERSLSADSFVAGEVKVIDYSNFLPVIQIH